MINVGWGSKQTQFHGSLGKSAAQAVATRLPAANPLDHQLPTISWRGDGSFFCVSSYDPYSTSSSRAGDYRRQVRIYARSPIALSATSEPIYGLEGAISWRPAGNLIAAVQGFGWDGGAEGEGEDRGRKDVIFLERNGLQHGQFRLREDERYRGKEALVKEGQCDWHVKQLAYSSDSEILAVWIQRDDADLGEHRSLAPSINCSLVDSRHLAVQLWTMNNYHYYLKQEILPPSSCSKRFTSVAWHQENPGVLYLTGRGKLRLLFHLSSRSLISSHYTDFALQRTFEWETATSRLAIPDDTGSVAVVDGGKLDKSPFAYVASLD
jgi:elongator complex protein 1